MVTDSISQTHGSMKPLAPSYDGSWALGWEPESVIHTAPHPSLLLVAPPWYPL